MSHSDYLSKLKIIRDQLWTGHVDIVMAYHQSSAREDLPKLLSSYESMRVLNRIIAAEEVRDPWVNEQQAAPHSVASDLS